MNSNIKHIADIQPLSRHGLTQDISDQAAPKKGFNGFFYLFSCLLIGITLIMSPLAAYGQSDNYWSWTFNTPSMLLAGSVVGGNAGSSALFYNPALINQDSMPSLSVSASITTLQRFKGENVAGENINLSKWVFKVQPRFVSYIFQSENEKFSLEAAFLSPVSEDLKYTIQHSDELDIIERTEGLEHYSGYINYNRVYDDLYFGTGFSYHLSDQVLLGASSFVSVKLLKYFYNQEAKASQQSDSVIIDNEVHPSYIAFRSIQEEMKYWDISLVFKGGVLFISKNKNISMGMNITFPNIPIYGEASIRKEYLRSDVYDNESDDFTKNENIYGTAIKARPRIKSPFSAAMGFQYATPNKRNYISLTAEYFHNIDMYSIIDIESDVDVFQGDYGSFSDISTLMTYYTEAKALTNFGIGFKQYISPSFSALGGFRTDFTSGTSDKLGLLNGRFKVNQVHLDQYHFTGGTVLMLKKSYVVAGLQYSFGRRHDMEEIVNFSDPVEYIPSSNQALEGVKQNSANFNIKELSVFFGLIVDFK